MGQRNIPSLLNLPPRNTPLVSDAEVEQIRQQWVAKVHDIFDGMRRNVDVQSAATAKNIGDSTQVYAITDLLVMWKRVERQVVEYIRSPETTEAIRQLVLSGDTAKATENLDFLYNWLANSHGQPSVEDFMRKVVELKVMKERENVAEDQPSATPWRHSINDTMPQQFVAGPLVGSGVQLDAAIFNRDKPDRHFRQLKRKGQEGRLWIVGRTRTCLQVWFCHDRSYTTAKSRLDRAAEADKVAPEMSSAKASGKRR